MSEPPKPLGEVLHTLRGFEMLSFTDAYCVPCSLQASSIAEVSELSELGEPGTCAVWLGVQDPKPGSPNTRMHLDREQVAGLIAHLQAWLATGSFMPEKDEPLPL